MVDERVNRAGFARVGASGKGNLGAQGRRQITEVVCSDIERGAAEQRHGSRGRNARKSDRISGFQRHLFSGSTSMKRIMALAAMLAAVTAVAAEPPFKGDAAKAQSIVDQVCAACHASDGNSQIPVNPKLAGQIPEYLHKQLTN